MSKTRFRIVDPVRPAVTSYQLYLRSVPPRTGKPRRLAPSISQSRARLRTYIQEIVGGSVPLPAPLSWGWVAFPDHPDFPLPREIASSYRKHVAEELELTGNRNPQENLAHLSAPIAHDSCSLCIGSAEHEAFSRMLPCGHVFHAECAVDFGRYGEDRSREVRSDVDSDDIDNAQW